MRRAKHNSIRLCRRAIAAAALLALLAAQAAMAQQDSAEAPRRSSWTFLPAAPANIEGTPESATPGAPYRLIAVPAEVPHAVAPPPPDQLPAAEDFPTAGSPPAAPPLPPGVAPPLSPPALLYSPSSEGTVLSADAGAYDAAPRPEFESFDAACEECEEPSWCDRLGCLSPCRWLPEPPEITQVWAERPLRVGLFLSVLEGDELIQGQVGQGNGALGGLRLGCDLDDYWGLEARLGFGSADVENLVGAADVRSGQLTVADISVLYYPWPSPRWRPFLSAGAGLAWFDFRDQTGENVANSTPSFPLGLGASYRIDDAAALRLELFDTIAVGDGSELDTTHNVSFGAALEYRFGGPRRSYWPWEPPPRVW